MAVICLLDIDVGIVEGGEYTQQMGVSGGGGWDLLRGELPRLFV